MAFLYFLESIRNPVLDLFFSIITLCGEETIFMAIGLVVFWCFDKRQGYYLLCVGFLGTVINQFLKMVFRVPRPWIKTPILPSLSLQERRQPDIPFRVGTRKARWGCLGESHDGIATVCCALS